MTSWINVGANVGRLPTAVQAAFWFLIAGGMFVGMMAVVRHIADDVDVLVIVFWRTLFGIALMMPWLIRTGPAALKTRRLRWHTVRGCVTFASLLSWLYAATLMPLADITAIGFTRPIIASLLAVAILGEAMRARRWVATLIGFIGAMIIVRPGFTDFNPGIWWIFGGVAGASAMSIMTKFVSRTDPPDTMTMYLLVIMMPISFVAALFVWEWPAGNEWLWIVAAAVLATYSQRALARAYHAADATVVLSFDFLRLPVAAAIGFVFFSEFPDAWVWIGASVICASSVYIGHRESVVERRDRTDPPA